MDTKTRAVAVGLALLVVAGVGVVPVASLTHQSPAAQKQATETAEVRVAHMSPDAPAVNVRVDDETVEQNVDFGDVTSYLELEAGDHQVSLVAVENETMVFDGQVSVEADRSYTLMAVGEVAENATEEFEVVALQDAESAPSEDASVRLVHASPDAGPVDVTVNQTGDVLFDDVEFGNATDYVTVPAGSYTLNVRAATESNDGEIVATFDETLVNETAYSAFAGGYAAPGDAPADESLALFVQIDRTENPEIPGVTTTAANQTTTTADAAETTVEHGEETTEG